MWHLGIHLASKRDPLAGSAGGKRPDPKADCRLSDMKWCLKKQCQPFTALQAEFDPFYVPLSSESAMTGERIPYDLLRDEPEAPVPWSGIKSPVG